MACMKYVEKRFWKECLCALQVFLCALVSQLVCARNLERTLLEGHHRKVEGIVMIGFRL